MIADFLVLLRDAGAGVNTLILVFFGWRLVQQIEHLQKTQERLMWYLLTGREEPPESEKPQLE